MKLPRVLIIEDNRPLALSIAALAERHGWQGETVPTLSRAEKEWHECHFDLVLLDLGLPDGNGLDFLKRTSQRPEVPIAVMTAHGDVENAIAARQLGASQFFDKPIDFEGLVAFLNESRNAIEKPQPIKEDSSSLMSATALIGAAPQMRPVVQLIAQACATTVPLVVRGEIGTGRTHVARLIQQNSKLPGDALLQGLPSIGPTRCVEAVSDAAGSSLVIENLPALPLESQEALLNSLQMPGGKQVRIIATVDQEGLHAKVLAGALLPDLYYRLQVLEIELPPLRERLEDLPVLASCFLGELSASRSRSLSPSLIDSLMEHPWQGNLHELRNLIKYLVVAHPEVTRLHADHLPPYFGENRFDPGTHTQDPFEQELQKWIERKFAETGASVTYKELHGDLERRLLELLLKRHENKPSRLARAMKMNRVTLRKKLRGPGDENDG